MNNLEDHTMDIEILTRQRTYVIGLCIMESMALFGIVDARGNVLCKERVDMHNYPEPSTFVFDICDRLQPMIEQVGGIELIKSMGIACGSGNNNNGCVENPTNLKWRGKTALAKMFQGSLGIAVSLINDATAAAMGEAAFGAAHGLQNFVVIYMYAGLGAGIYLNNRIVRGHNGRVGEIGHVTVFPGGRPCGCGKVGCLESYASLRGIVYNTQDILKEHPDVPSVLREVAPEELTVNHIHDAAEAGDKVALEALRYTGELLGQAMIPLVSAINPEAIIITGWVGTMCGKFMQKPMLEALNDKLFKDMQWQTSILVSPLEPFEAPLLYASAEAWNTKEL